MSYHTGNTSNYVISQSTGFTKVYPKGSGISKSRVRRVQKNRLAGARKGSDINSWQFAEKYSGASTQLKATFI